MDIYRKLPSDIANKIFKYFRSPNATILFEDWKKTTIDKKKCIIAQLNRWNRLIYGVDSHNFGRSANLRRMGHEALINGKNKMNILLKMGVFHTIDFEKSNYNHNPWSPRRKKRIQKLIFGDNNINCWKKRSLFGGDYPINRRPKTIVPRNPFTHKWNLRWNKDGILWKLLSYYWKPNLWGWLHYDGPGSICSINNIKYISVPSNSLFTPIHLTNTVELYI